MSPHQTVEAAPPGSGTPAHRLRDQIVARLCATGGPTFAFWAAFLATTCLAFAGLDSASFWDDEAMVGILALNLLTTGRFAGWGGHVPDWIVSFGRRAETADLVAYFSRPIRSRGTTAASRYELAATLDVYCADTQRPELAYHSFGPVRVFDRRSAGVYVYRAVRPRDGP